MTYNSHAYLLIFLIIRINSAKNALSPIFEFKSMEKLQKHVPDVFGLYQATNKTSNNFIVYKRLETEMYIFVNVKGFWAVSKKLPPTSKVLYRSKSANETINEEPPATGWQYRKTKKEDWKDDETIQWTKFDCCDEINLESEGATSKTRHSTRLGKYTKTEETAAGKFVYKQNDGNNVLYYEDKQGWFIDKNVNEKKGLRYFSPSSCPIPMRKSTSDPDWKYYSSGKFKSDQSAVSKCWIRTVSNVICLTENSTLTNNTAACKFPFRFRGKVYDGCIRDHDDPNKAWCSTGEEAEDGTYTYQNNRWGYCQSNCTLEKQDQDLALPLSGIIVLSALTPLVVLLVIGLSVYAIRNLRCNCKFYKDREIVEQNPVYGLGDDDDAIEATDANSIYGDEDDEYENIENA